MLRSGDRERRRSGRERRRSGPGGPWEPEIGRRRRSGHWSPCETDIGRRSVPLEPEIDGRLNNKYPLCHECGNKHPPLFNRSCPQKRSPCEECGKEHFISSYCPYIPYCKICFSKDHNQVYCPFLKSYPRGAVFDETKYEVVCFCNAPFDTDKWLCTRCTDPPKPPSLLRKYCLICQISGEHVTLDCPQARQIVADYKSSGNDTYLSPKLLLNKWKKLTGSSSLGRQEYMDPIPTMIRCRHCRETHTRAEDDCLFKPELCSECGKKHMVRHDCPNVPCKVCYKEGHGSLHCPFTFEYPRGANFNEADYEVVCICGNKTFDTSRWVCTSCNSTVASLRLKSCDTCHVVGVHVTSECPLLGQPAEASHWFNTFSDVSDFSFCHRCGKEHMFTPECPYGPCKICYKEDHYRLDCPLLFNYPRGENFDSTAYEIVCKRCGMPFDTNTWLCTFCTHSQFAKLHRKHCEICGSTGDHITFECPGDQELAAASKYEHYARYAARHREVNWCSSQI